MINRMVRAVRLDSSLAAEVVREGAFSQAFLVVVIAAIAQGIGQGGAVALRGVGILEVLIAAVLWLAGLFVAWAVAGAIYFLAARVFGGRGTYAGMMTALGFAQAPLALGILGFIPVLGGIILLVAGILTAINYVFAIRGSQEMETGRAILAWLLPTAIVIALVACLAIFVAGAAMFEMMF